ncbi:MAG: uracil-DNA glycosylase [Rickettsiales bacterium]|nr:uracil-DNA glycosylase [Rickettsiales bacterium]
MLNNYLQTLEIQKDFGVDWVFSSDKNPLFESKPSNLKNINLSQAPNEMPKKANKTEEKIKAPFSKEENFTNKSTQELIDKARSIADKAKNLDELKELVENFDGLAIKKSATNCVFAEGNRKSKIMFIGEAPGENEDIQARPFCGVSGRLLDEMIKYMGFTRNSENPESSFYITNSVFWRPPGNRKPTPEEIAICRPFVEKHIALINPKVIVLVGATATNSVVNSKESISLLRGQIMEYNDNYNRKKIDCFAIFHPSYLLRQPSQKKNVWFDLLKIKKHLESI